ncbi:hypothetical protein GGF42_002434 [Coemansia sp. RSA 2424]|nr:hypothetical protein GGF42_002434 [Coemansia sp. RSA 2424]
MSGMLLLGSDEPQQTPSSSSSRSSSWRSLAASPTPSPTVAFTGSSRGLSSSTPPPLSPLYRPSEQISRPEGWGSSSPNSGSTGDISGDSSGGDSKMKTVVSSSVSVVVFLVVVALIYRCIRKRRRARDPGEGALQLNSEASGGSSLPATPMSLSGTGGVFLDLSFGSQSSVSLAQSRLTSPSSAPYSQTSGPPVEMAQVRFHGSTTARHPAASAGPDDGRPSAPMPAATRPRPPPPPPRLRAAPPLPPRVLPRERADTFSDIPHDDLPPYVDPIEEAMSATRSESEASAAPAPASQQPCPPPYHVVDISAPATPR